MHRPLVAVSLSLCALMAAGCTSHPSPQGDPDPGSTRITLLRSVVRALPANAITREQRVSPSRWDSCDGMSWSYGWDPMYVDLDFTTPTPAAALKEDVGRGLVRMGWRVAPPFGGSGQNWSRSLIGGGIATLALHTSQSHAGQWSLHASAPPATHPATGC